jgi:hypothetical protein
MINSYYSLVRVAGDVDSDDMKVARWAVGEAITQLFAED